MFIKENLASFTGQPANLCVAALLPFLLALSTLRGVASLAPFSLVADAANAIGALPLPLDTLVQDLNLTLTLPAFLAPVSLVANAANAIGALCCCCLPVHAA